MTTVERYRPSHIFSSDAPSKARRSHSSSTTIANIANRANIPPAVPSPPPPRLSRQSRDSPPQKPHFYDNTSPTFEMAQTMSSQWIFTDAELASTPSIRDGWSTAQERFYRAKGCNFIFQVGMLLQLPQVTISTASIFFHRFYMRKSMIDEKGGWHPYPIAGTSIFLATKTEETCRKTKEIVIACARVALKDNRIPIDEQSKEYWRWRDNILMYEELMLETLTFDLSLDLPHRIFLDLLMKVPLGRVSNRMRDASWSFLNDSFFMTLCLSMTGKEIAISALYFGAQFTGAKIADSDDGTPWWEALGGNPDSIFRGCSDVMEYWKANPLQRNNNYLYEHSPKSINSDDHLQGTRRRTDLGSSEGSLSPGHSQMARTGSHQGPTGNSAVNGARENSQPPRTNGSAENSRNGDTHGSVAKKAIENGECSSDKPLKEIANNLDAHAPDSPSRKRKEPSNGSEAEQPRKRSKSSSQTSPSESSAVVGERRSSNTTTSNIGDESSRRLDKRSDESTATDPPASKRAKDNADGPTASNLSPLPKEVVGALVPDDLKAPVSNGGGTNHQSTNTAAGEESEEGELEE